MRIVAGLIAGLVLAAVAILVISQVGAMLFPVASLDADARDPERFSAAFRGAPLGTKLSLVFSLLGAAWAGGAAARTISRRRWTIWVIAGFLFLLSLSIVNIIALPVWMQFALVLAPVIGAVLARHVPAERIAATSHDGERNIDAPLQ